MAASGDDRDAILGEIEQTIAAQRARLRDTIAEYSASRTGARLPVMVNAALVVTVAVAGALLWHAFAANQETYVLRASGDRALDADIVAALLAETETALDEKERAIRELRSELDSVNARLAEIETAIQDQLETLRATMEAQDAAEPEITRRLDGERQVLEERFADEREGLLARRERLNAELAVRIREQEALLAQVSTQRQLLDESGGGAGSGAPTELDQLAEQQRLRELFDQRVLSGYRRFSAAAAQRSWDEADAALTDLASFLASGELAVGSSEARTTHLAVVSQLEELVTVAADGWPEDATADLLPGWSGVRERLVAAQRSAAAGDTARAAQLYQAAITEIPGMGGGLGLLTRQAQERSVTAIAAAVQRSREGASDNPEEVLAAITGELEQSGTDVPAPVRELTLRLQDALAAVTEQQQELRTLTDLSQQQLELLRESVSGERAPASSSVNTVEGIAAEIEALQGRVAESRDRQATMQQRIADLEAENAALSAETADLGAFRDRVDAMSRGYRQQTAGIRGETPTDDREVVRAALNRVYGSLDAEVARELFPQLGTTLRTLTDALVELESARAAAEAEAQVLMDVQSATERVSEEQMRLLAFAQNNDQDTMELLDSLVNEIDTLAETRREARENTSYARAMGVIVRADRADGTLVVQRAATIDTRDASRIFINRELPNGDRIPIADVEIVATSGENTIVRVVSTIAPTIRPQVNDLVYVEF